VGFSPDGLMGVVLVVPGVRVALESG